MSRYPLVLKGVFWQFNMKEELLVGFSLAYLPFKLAPLIAAPMVLRVAEDEARKFPFVEANGRCRLGAYRGSCDELAKKHDACPHDSGFSEWLEESMNNVVHHDNLYEERRTISLPNVYQHRAANEDDDFTSAERHFLKQYGPLNPDTFAKGETQYIYNTTPQGAVMTEYKWCERQCHDNVDCTGYQLSNLYVPSQWQTCTLWLWGSCAGEGSKGWSQGLGRRVHGNYLPRVLVKTQQSSFGWLYFFLNHQGNMLNSDWWATVISFVFSILTLVICMVVGFLLISTSAPYGTLQFYQHVAAQKKGKVWNAMFWVATSGCVFYAGALSWLLLQRRLTDFSLLILPLSIAGNAIDLRRFNKNLYPAHVEGAWIDMKLEPHEHIFTAEAVLEVVENGVLAKVFAVPSNAEPLERILTPGEDVQKVVRAYCDFGKGVEPRKGNHIWFFPRALYGLVAAPIQGKAYLLILFGAQELLTVAFDSLLLYFITASDTDVTNGFKWIFSTLLTLFLTPLPVLLYLDNPFPFGTFQYYQKIVSSKKKYKVFRQVALIFFASTVIMIAFGAMWAHGVAGGIGPYLSEVLPPFALILVNLLHTVKFNRDLYPSPFTTEQVRLKLNMPFDVASSAEQMLDRVENAYLALKVATYANHDQHLKNLIDDEDQPSMIEILKEIGHVDTSDDGSEMFARSIKALFDCVAAVWRCLASSLAMIASLISKAVASVSSFCKTKCHRAEGREPLL